MFPGHALVTGGHRWSRVVTAGHALVTRWSRAGQTGLIKGSSGMKRVQRLLPFLLNLHVPSPPSREASGGGRGRFACGSNGFSQERSLLFRAHEKRLGRERPWGARPSISRCAGNQAVGLADFGVFVLRTWGLRALPSKALTRFTDPSLYCVSYLSTGISMPIVILRGRHWSTQDAHLRCSSGTRTAMGSVRAAV